MTAPTLPPSADQALLFDAQRGRYYTKPLLRGWLHLVTFEASLVLGTLVIVGADGALRVTAAVIFASSVSALFGVSAAYHRGNWGAATSAWLQRADHAMIFVLIAGTATPAFLLALPGSVRIVAVAGMWGLSALAAGIHLVWMAAPERVVGGVFIALGCLAAGALPAVWIRSGPVPALLLLGGGVLYIVGAVSYHRRRPDPAPSVFGYHEVFHSYVCLAAACHYVAIALFIL